MQTRRYLLISPLSTPVNSMLESTLRGHDELATAHDPIEALRDWSSPPPDAVLWAMDTSDEEAVVACRTMRRTWGAPIVMLVDPGAREQILRGYRLGADACIAVPCDRREFDARIRAVLRRP